MIRFAFALRFPLGWPPSLSAEERLADLIKYAKEKKFDEVELPEEYENVVAYLMLRSRLEGEIRGKQST